MIVVDTNVVVYFYVISDWTPLAQKCLELDSEWLAPILWRSEFMNVLTIKMKGGEMTLEEAVEAFDKADALVNTTIYRNPEEILSLASTSGCTAYDCEFVAAAKTLGVPLVTMDSQVLQAFPDVAISLVDFAQPEPNPEDPEL